MLQPNRHFLSWFVKLAHGESYKYYIFKNTDRRRSLRRWNILFIFLLTISMILITLSITILSFIGIIWLFTVGKADITSFLNFALLIGLIGFAIMLSKGILFFIENHYIKREVEELKNNELELAENQKYLNIAKAIKKIRFFSLIFSVIEILLITIFAVLTISDINNKKDFSAINAFYLIIILAYIIIGSIAKAIFSGHTNYKIRQDVMDIRAHWKHGRKNTIN